PVRPKNTVPRSIPRCTRWAERRVSIRLTIAGSARSSPPPSAYATASREQEPGSRNGATTMKCRNISHRRQDGAALILALIFLLLMTMLSTSSMRTSTMQERMAGNTRDWNLGFQSAEAALRVAEQFLRDEVVLPEFNDANGYYEVNSS